MLVLRQIKRSGGWSDQFMEDGRLGRSSWIDGFGLFWINEFGRLQKKIKNGGSKGIRTPDLLVANEALSQLS